MKDAMLRLLLFAFFGMFLLIGGVTAGAWFAQSLPITDLEAGHLWATASSR
jgi:hypothetical protein